VTSTVALRPYEPQDSTLLARSESEFDDFGPAGVDPTRTLPSSSLDDRGGLAITEAGRVVGGLSWLYTQWGPNASSRCIMIGIGLLPEARGRGIGTEAQLQLVEMIFRHTRAERVEAATEVENAAERRSLEKAGFTAEGVIRGSMWRRGRFRDQVLYSRLRSDPDPRPRG